ncbi:MAG TPA: DedA family protein [Vicinamibacterales bacterium]
MRLHRLQPAMTDWITGALERSGYLGIFLLMVAENAFPPIPSELIMPFAGFTASRGDLQLPLVILAGSAGSVSGAYLWYIVGRALGADALKRVAERRGRWLTLSPGEVDQAVEWFSRRCGRAVFLGRLVPTVRTLISVPAGIAEMARGRFLLLTSLGTAIWSGMLAIAGYVLEGRFADVERYTNPISTAVAVGIAAWYVWRVVTFRSRVPPPVAG